MGRRYTPEMIERLADNEIFVFGSNLDGAHGGGAARDAYAKFGAIWGKGVGIQGHSYAIPTMQGGVNTIRPYVDEFIDFAKAHPHFFFLVTRIGCGIAGLRDEEIAPLFDAAYDLGNVALPESFCKVIEDERGREMISRWSNLDMVQMNRALRGEAPVPTKTEKATAGSWQTLPMPESSIEVELNVRISAEDFRPVEMGHIPLEMEDHWFMYCDSGHVRWYRSWTGICIFDASYGRDGDAVTLARLVINRDPSQFGSTDDVADTNLFLALLSREMGADPEKYWKEYWKRTK